MKQWIVWIVGFVLWGLPTDRAFAVETADLSVEIHAAYWTRDRALAAKNDIPVASVWIKGATHFSDAWSANVDAYIADDRLLKAPTVEARKAYLRWQSTNWEIRVGRQIEPWGRSDILTPTDNLGSWNYTALFPYDDDQRQGLFMARADYVIDNYKIEAVWLPEFRPSAYPLPAAFKTSLVSQSRDRWQADQFAAKIDQSGAAIDWSISWFHGLDRTFSLAILPAAGASGAVEQIYPTIDVVGADAATAISGIGLRGEVAYTSVSAQAPGTLTRKSQLQLQLGAEVLPFSSSTLNVYYFGRHVTGFKDPSVLAQPMAQLAKSISALWFQQDQYQNGVGARFATAFLNDTLTAELTNVILAPTGEGTTRMISTYAISDNLKLIGGLNWFWGPTSSYFGSIRKTSGAFAEIRYSF